MQTLSRVFYLGMTGTALELKQEPGDKVRVTLRRLHATG
jgi:hypothetical protein